MSSSSADAINPIISARPGRGGGVVNKGAAAELDVQSAH